MSWERKLHIEREDWASEKGEKREKRGGDEKPKEESQKHCTKNNVISLH